MERFFYIAVPLLVAIAPLAWYCVRSYARSIPATNPLAPKPLETILNKIDVTPDSPTSFGYKMSWLAIKSSDAEAVLKSLDIQNVQPANWQTGFVAAYNGHVFVSPPVKGWVFVVSPNLPSPDWSNGTGAWNSLLEGLSKKFGEAQYFGTHRIVGYCAWARFINGKETRAFGFSGERGETLADGGEKTAGEIELGYDYLAADSDIKSESYWERDDACWPDEEHVMEVAGKWSVNPMSLEELGLPRGVGWIGNFSDRVVG
jgi:hypothetical protein